MLKVNITPRFNDTDALGHINNASITTWFEEGRRPIFQYFVPDLDPKKWNLILARVEVDYLAQSSFGEEVLIQTWFEKIGSSSMTIIQEAIQGKTIVARGKCVMVHFDYSSNKPSPIPTEIKTELQKHLPNNS